ARLDPLHRRAARHRRARLRRVRRDAGAGADHRRRPRPGRGGDDPVMIALVAGATRGGGRGIAVGVGEGGADVYVTGRSTRARRSEIARAETIEETAELVTAAGGTGIAVPTDHLAPDQVRALVERIDAEQGRLDVLVNDVWGSEHLFEFDST